VTLLSSALPLAFESSVMLHVDGAMKTTFMCTPVCLEELAAGYMFTSRIIACREQIGSISIAKDNSAVEVETLEFEASGSVSASFPGFPGAAAIRGDDFDDNKPASDGHASNRERWPVRLEEIQRKAAEMFSRAEMYRKTGGMHCAALWMGDDTLIVREDVGRHNAVDKVIGRAFLDRRDFSQAVLLTSGRLAADMVAKARNAGIPVLVTRSIPTSTAYNIALDAGMTILGRIETKSPLLYTFPERICEIQAQ